MASSSSSLLRDDDYEAFEEGEFVPGVYHDAASDDTDDDDAGRYSLQFRPREEEDDDEEEIRPPQLEEILRKRRAASLPSTYQYCDSDVTISDDDDDEEEAQMWPVYSCQVCGKEFGSRKAVDGHMRVHDPHGRRHGHAAVSGGWSVTGKRGSTGGSSKGKAAVSSSEELNLSTATVAPEPDRPLQPTMPLAFARSNLSPSLSMASARTNLMDSVESSSSSSTPMSIRNEPEAASGAYPSNETFVHQQLQEPQLVLQLAPPAPPVQGPDEPRREYTCKTCGKSYPTNQGFGGHMAGHKNRQKKAEAAAAAAGSGQDGSVVLAAAARQPEQEEHRCKKCSKAFTSGVALGGHMRMHYNGPPIVQRRNSKKPRVAPPPHASSAVCMENKAGRQPSLSPPAPSRLRLFGVDIWPAAEAPAVVQQGADTKAEAAPAVRQGTDTTPREEAPQEGSSSAMAEGAQRQDEIVEKPSTDSPSKESSD